MKNSNFYYWRWRIFYYFCLAGMFGVSESVSECVDACIFEWNDEQFLFAIDHFPQSVVWHLYYCVAGMQTV